MLKILHGTILLCFFYILIIRVNAQVSWGSRQRKLNIDESASSSEERFRKNHAVIFPSEKENTHIIHYPASNDDNVTIKIDSFDCLGPNCLDTGSEEKARLTTTNEVNAVQKCKNQNCRERTRDKKRVHRICEIKYAEYMTQIFSGAEDRADANDTEFDGRALADPGEYPHMTAVGWQLSDNTIDFKCGGSLISENFVITAAHCTNVTGVPPTTVRIGDLNLLVDEQNLEPQIRTIAKIHSHPLYNSSSYYHDIALLELNQEVAFTVYVRPIRLWTRHEIPYTTVYAMGYGSTAFGKASTNRLTDMNKTIVPNDECNNELPALPSTANGIITSLICARDYEMNRDTCQGDSGGPLQLNLFGRRKRNRIHYHLVGITSYGLFCRSGFPSVYTRVSSFLDWIEQIVWET